MVSPKFQNSGGPGHGLECSPYRDLPERIPARVPDAVDHLAPPSLDLVARHAGVLDDGIGIAVAPRLPDARERLARRAKRVEHDVVDGDVLQSQIGQVGEHLAADMQVTADRRTVAVRDALPEPVGVEL